jgi:hypothetical protein
MHLAGSFDYVIGVGRGVAGVTPELRQKRSALNGTISIAPCLKPVSALAMRRSGEGWRIWVLGLGRGYGASLYDPSLLSTLAAEVSIPKLFDPPPNGIFSRCETALDS